MDIRVSRDPKTDGAVPPQVRRGLLLLLQASKYARELARDVWDFAVEIATLQQAGLTNSDFRWLICKGYVEHAREITMSGENGRQFKRGGDLIFGKRTSFVLTGSGVRAAGEICKDATVFENGRGKVFWATGRPTVESLYGRPQEHIPAKVPRWDRDRRELRLGDHLVKVFKQPSPNQEIILMAFEEEKWPPRIDDPLPPHPDLVPKQRLRDAIKSLNRNQKARLIRFMGDGTAEGIRWELVPDSGQRDHSQNGSGRD